VVGSHIRQPLFLCHAARFLRRRQKFRVIIGNERTEVSHYPEDHLLEL
jgi:hypothetical protein